jgi:vancomycin resistance protein YoaR
VSDRPYAYRTNDRRVIPWLLFGLVVLFGGLYVAAHFFTNDRIPRGTTVSGVDVGGMLPAVAEQRLSQRLAAVATKPIRVTANGTSGRIDPAAAGLDLDVAASIARAGGGRSWDPTRMWDYVAGGDDLDAVVDVDRARLDAAVASFADRADQPPKEGRVTFTGAEATAHYPSAGALVDRSEAARAVRSAYLSMRPGAVALPVRTAQPEISKADVSRAMDSFANPALSAPVRIRLAGEDVVLRPKDFAPALSMVAQGGALVPRLDDSRLLTVVRSRMRTSSAAAKDATVRLVDGVPKVVPAKDGVTFAPEDVTGAFLALVVAEDNARTLTVPSVAARPAFSTADAKALGITEKVSEFTTHYPHADYRNTNLGRAAALINGTVLKPGDTFSLNDVVGERTRANGFTKGFIISDGVFKEDYGGGVSQVATTTFNAAFFAGLADVEHKPHSFYIDRYPVGREATVAWPNVDLKFKDTTPYGVLVQAWIDPSSPSRQGAMHVRMWSTKYWHIVAGQSARYNFTQPTTRYLSGAGCVPNSGYGGFDIDVYRYFYKAGSRSLDHKETMHTTYTPSDSVVCS